MAGIRTLSRQMCRYVVCAALVVAAVADAGPEIVSSGSLMADYDGPGPLIYLAFAVLVAVAPWRYTPLAAVALSVFFIVGGFADPVFRERIVTPREVVYFAAGLVQMLAFATAIGFGLAAVWLSPIVSPNSSRSPQEVARTMDAPSATAADTRRSLRPPLGGLGLAIVGLIIQWVSKPSIFEAPNWGALPGNFPPGALVITLFGGLTALCARWWWAPVFSAAIGVWVLYGGIVTGEMANAITNGNAGSIIGLLIMSVGLAIAVVTGVLVMVQRRRSS